MLENRDSCIFEHVFSGLNRNNDDDDYDIIGQDVPQDNMEFTVMEWFVFACPNFLGLHNKGSYY